MNIDVILEAGRVLLLSDADNNDQVDGQVHMQLHDGDGSARINMTEEEAWILWRSVGSLLNQMSGWSYESDDYMNEALCEKYEN